MITNYDLTVIIIGRNEYATLQKNLHNLEEYTKKTLLSLQIVYIDSDSSDGSLEMVCRHRDKVPNLRAIRLAGQMNASVARNAGIRYAEGKYILFLDGDVVFNCEFILHALDLFQQSHGIGAVTGKLLEVFDPEKPWVFVDRERHGKKKSCCLGGNFICRSTTVQEIGFFDEKLVLNEDIDYTIRIYNRNLDLIELNHVFGVHFTEPYNEIKRLCRDLARFHYVYPGVLLRKYLFRRGIINVICSQISIYLRFVTVLAVLLVLINPLLILPSFAIFIFVVFRVKKHLQETMFSRALSFLKGVQVAVGLFFVKQKPHYQVIKVL